MKAACEGCAAALPPDAEAYVCSYGCTFCPDCAARFDGVCPNCGGAQRPRTRYANFAYRLVDVFTQVPLQGNPLAVFIDAAALDGRTMQAVAKELNLAEVAFILPVTRPGAAARVRIFSPDREMPFAGHPTLGAAFALRALGLVQPECDAFELQEEIGGVRIHAAPDGRLWFESPAPALGDAIDRGAVLHALGLPAEDALTNVPCRLAGTAHPNLYVALREPSVVDRVVLDPPAFARLVGGRDAIGLYAFAPTPQGAYARMFAPAPSLREDAATGSAAAPLAALMMRYGHCSDRDGTQIVVEQGVAMGRRSLLHVRVRGHAGSAGFDVGGDVVEIANGTMMLPIAGGAPPPLAALP